MSRILRWRRSARAAAQRRSWSASAGAEESAVLYGNGWDSGPRSVRVAVWWDFEGCDIPAGIPATNVGNNIVAALRTRGFKGPVSIDAYGDTWQLSRSTQEALASTGISLHHLPSSRKNASSDRTLMVDLVLWTMDHPPPAHLFVISGDADLSSPLHSLRMKNYNVLLACDAAAASPALLAVASAVWHWGNIARGQGLVDSVTPPPPPPPPPTYYTPPPPPPPPPLPFFTSPSPPSRPYSVYIPPPPPPSFCTSTTPPPSLFPTPLSPPPPPPPPPSCCSSPSPPPPPPASIDPPPPPSPYPGSRERLSPVSETEAKLDDFHKDICSLLQQAASSLNQKPAESILPSLRKDLDAARVDDSTTRTGSTSSSSSSSSAAAAAAEAGTVSSSGDKVSDDVATSGKLAENIRSIRSECHQQESIRDDPSSTDEIDPAKVVVEVAKETPTQQQHRIVNSATTIEDQSCCSSANVAAADRDGKWTWRTFLFGSTGQEKGDNGEDSVKDSSQSRSSSGRDDETSNQSSFWDRFFFWRDNSDNTWDVVKHFLNTDEAALILSKSTNRTEFARRLRESGPSCIRNWEYAKLSELVDRLVAENEIDASIWKPETNSSKIKTDQQEEHSSRIRASKDIPWESIRGHSPSIEELRIWLVYFLEVEQERRSFDVSHLKAEFKKNFGVSLNLSVFGCLRIKDLLNVMQDIIHVNYPKPSVCMIRTKSAPKLAKSNPRTAIEHAQMLEELLLEHNPGGVPISMIKARFYAKFRREIDHQRLGFARLDKFLRATGKNIVARVDSVEQSVYVLCRRQEDRDSGDEEDGDGGRRRLRRTTEGTNIIVDKEISF